SRTLLLCLFSILYFFTAVGCVHGIYGFVLRRLRSRGASQLARDPGIDISQTSTALVFPIYNEDVQRVFAGIQAVYQSLATTGHINRFDFFVLSDSTDPSKWVEEERAWFDIARRLDALDRIF